MHPTASVGLFVQNGAHWNPHQKGFDAVRIHALRRRLQELCRELRDVVDSLPWRWCPPRRLHSPLAHSLRPGSVAGSWHTHRRTWFCNREIRIAEHDATRLLSFLLSWYQNVIKIANTCGSCLIYFCRWPYRTYLSPCTLSRIIILPSLAGLRWGIAVHFIVYIWWAIWKKLSTHGLHFRNPLEILVLW